MFNWVADAVTAICVATIFAVVVANFLQAEPGRSFRERRAVKLQIAAALAPIQAIVTLQIGSGGIEEQHGIFLRQ